MWPLFVYGKPRGAPPGWRVEKLIGGSFVFTLNSLGLPPKGDGHPASVFLAMYLATAPNTLTGQRRVQAGKCRKW